MPPRLPPRLALSALLALAAPAAALAERVPPLAPPPAFDPLAVPMAPLVIAPPEPVPAPRPPVVVPGSPAPSRAAAIPAQAQGTAPPTGNPLDQVIGSILGGLMTDMQPTFDEMARGLDSVATKYGPILDQLGGLVDDIGNYQRPERLPNGDILIRRRADAPPPPAMDGALGGLLSPRPDPAQPAAPAPIPPQEDQRPPLAGPIPTGPAPGAIDL